MKILIISLNYSPELTGIGKYVGEMTEWLDEGRAEVRVITAPPYYPAWRVASGYRGLRYWRETAGSRRVYRCPLYVPGSPSGLKRLLHQLSFALSSFPVALWQMLAWRPQVVFVVEPPLMCAPAAIGLSWLTGARVWLHVQDFELDAAFELGLLRAAWLRRLAGAFERWVMGRCARVSTISWRMLEKLSAKGVPPARQYLFPNWTDFEVIRPSDAPNPLRATLGIGADEVVVLYSGNMGRKQGLDILATAAAGFQPEERVVFLLCGEGPVLAELRAATAGLGHVRFLPLQPLERLNDLMNAADIHVLPQRADVEDLVMPSKLTNMMASGRPVIATARADTEVAHAVADAGCLVAPGDVAGLVAAIRTLAAAPERRRQLGLAARERALDLWDKRRVLADSFAEPSLATLLATR